MKLCRKLYEIMSPPDPLKAAKNHGFLQFLWVTKYLLQDVSKMAKDGPRRPQIIRNYVGIYMKLCMKLYEMM